MVVIKSEMTTHYKTIVEYTILSNKENKKVSYSLPSYEIVKSCVSIVEYTGSHD